MVFVPVASSMSVRTSLRYLSRPRSSTTSSRSVWTTSTYISSSPIALVKQVESAHKDADSGVTLYTVSKNVPFSLHQTVYATFAKSSSIGAVSEVLPSSSAKLLAPALEQSREELYSIAVASYKATGKARAIPFQSALQGRPNIALGREIKQQDEGDLNEAGLQAFLSGKTWGFGEDVNVQNGQSTVLQELEGVPSVERWRIWKDVSNTFAVHSPESVKEVVFFTADRVSAFLGALSKYEAASKVSIFVECRLIRHRRPSHETDRFGRNIYSVPLA